MSLLTQNDNDYVTTYGGPIAHVFVHFIWFAGRALVHNYVKLSSKCSNIKLPVHSVQSYVGSLTRQGKAVLLSENVSRTFLSGDSELRDSTSSARTSIVTQSKHVERNLWFY